MVPGRRRERGQSGGCPGVGACAALSLLYTRRPGVLSPGRVCVCHKPITSSPRRQPQHASPAGSALPVPWADPGLGLSGWAVQDPSKGPLPGTGLCHAHSRAHSGWLHCACSCALEARPLAPALCGLPGASWHTLMNFTPSLLMLPACSITKGSTVCGCASLIWSATS